MKSKALPPEQRSSKRGGKFFPALCNTLGTLILLAVILTSLPLTIPRFLGYEIYNVVSGSMEPTIPVGSLVYVAPAEPEAVQEGDIIAFRSGDAVVTHRVVRNKLVVGEFVTKGDANTAEDLSTVPYRALIGRVTRHFPVLGEVMTLYASRVGKIYLLVFAACGVMFNLLAGRMRERRREGLRRELQREMTGMAAETPQKRKTNQSDKTERSL